MKKIALVGLYILFHLFILREPRTTLFSWQTEGFVQNKVEAIDQVSVKELGTRLIYVEYQTDNFEKILHYKFPFGFFFLLGIIGLILIGSDKGFYIILIGIHAFMIIVASLTFSLFVSQGVWSLVVCDMLSRYFIPLSSIGIIPLSLLAKRNLLHERKAS
ncbi:MAG: hypothetical protein WD357_00610 [Gracilimonas sp.]